MYRRRGRFRVRRNHYESLSNGATRLRSTCENQHLRRFHQVDWLSTPRPRTHWHYPADQTRKNHPSLCRTLHAKRRKHHTVELISQKDGPTYPCFYGVVASLHTPRNPMKLRKTRIQTLLVTVASFNLIKMAHVGTCDKSTAGHAALLGGNQLLKIRGTKSLEVKISGTVDTVFST